jgi:4a-hydroxytetrahydrobiopterin dehydratase
MSLVEKRCVPCRGGIPPLPRPDAERLLAETPGWGLDAAATAIERTFRFPDFAAALAFVNRVGAVAEAEDHHPDVTFGWGYCRVVFQTHKIKGLHENDFVMAAKVNALAESS